MRDPTLSVAQIPIAARWTLYALGAVDGQRVRRPRDPVAAWLLRRQPGLLPPTAIPSVLTMIRARTSIVDRMIEEEIARARCLGTKIAYWSFTPGFDARWYRILALVGDAIGVLREVEDPDLLALKTALLEESTFARQWTRISAGISGTGDKPSSSALKYSPVPPTMIGVCPCSRARANTSCTSAIQRATE